MPIFFGILLVFLIPQNICLSADPPCVGRKNKKQIKINRGFFKHNRK